MTAQRLHTVTRATNYTGMYIAQLLLQQGHRVQSITHHHPNWGSPFGDRVPLHPFNFDQPNLLRQTLEGTDTLFNTYWIRANHKDRTDQQYIEQTRVMFQAAREAGVRRIVHISITNPDPESDLPYFQGKGQLEDALRDLEGVSHAILRPTVIYSAEDMPLNIIAWTLRQFPVVLIPGRGKYEIQPVFVEDLAALAVEVMDQEENLEIDAVGPEGLHLRNAHQDHQEQDRRPVRRDADAEQHHLPGGKGPGQDAGRDGPHPGRNQGTLPGTPGIQVRRASPLPDQALRVAGRAQRPAGPELRQLDQSTLPIDGQKEEATQRHPPDGDLPPPDGIPDGVYPGWRVSRFPCTSSAERHLVEATLETSGNAMTRRHPIWRATRKTVSRETLRRPR